MLETHALNTRTPQKQKTKNKKQKQKQKKRKPEKEINEHCITARKVHDIPSPQHIFLAP